MLRLLIRRAACRLLGHDDMSVRSPSGTTLTCQRCGRQEVVSGDR